ncbi:unnamed protein product, partial [Thlaspi arvense]
DEAKNYLYEELWKLCGGPLFDLPKIRENVYYFPQRHIKYIDLGEITPIFDISSKFRCNDIDIQFKVENDILDVYTKISLLPDTSESEISILNGNQENQKIYYFTKVLSVPYIHQKDIFLQLVNIHDSKKIGHGRLGENGESRVGIQRTVHQQDNIPSSLISKQSMHHGIIVSAINAINTKSTFNSSQFIINIDKYIDAMNNKFKIISNTNCSSHWRDSDWRSLELKWDVAASIPRPDKVSPWEIEPLTSSSNIIQSHLKDKRSRHVDEIDMWIPNPTLTQ